MRESKARKKRLVVGVGGKQQQQQCGKGREREESLGKRRGQQSSNVNTICTLIRYVLTKKWPIHLRYLHCCLHWWWWWSLDLSLALHCTQSEDCTLSTYYQLL